MTFTTSMVPRDSVQDEDFAVGMELVYHLHPLDVLLPEPDGDFIGHKLSLARVLPKHAAHFALEIERSEDIARGAVVEAGDGSDDFPLRAFAAAGGAE
jgi:hypothetical protein